MGTEPVRSPFSSKVKSFFRMVGQGSRRAAVRWTVLWTLFPTHETRRAWADAPCYLPFPGSAGVSSGAGPAGASPCHRALQRLRLQHLAFLGTTPQMAGRGTSLPAGSPPMLRARVIPGRSEGRWLRLVES